MAVEPSDYSPQGTDPKYPGNHPIPLHATTVTAFVGRTQRGPLNEPVVVKSFDDYRRVFGGHSALSHVSYSVQQYFDHGGVKAVIVRVGNRVVRGTLNLPAGETSIRLQARDPGSFEFIRASVDADGIDEKDDRFNLVIQRLIRPGSQLVEDQELFRGLSMDATDEAFIVDALKTSRIVRLSGPVPPLLPDLTRPSHPGLPIPYVEIETPGSDGEELTDYDVIGSRDERTGFFALEAVDNIDFLCIPLLASRRELGITTFLAAERYCKERHAVLIWDPPWSWNTVQSALIGMRDSGLSSQNAMTYFPRCRVSENGDRFPDGVPVCGAVAGTLARNDEKGVWQDLDECASELKATLEPGVDLGRREAAMLRRQGINIIASPHGGQARIYGNVTLAGPSAVARLSQRLDRRRLTFFILSMIRDHTRWAALEPYDSELEAECKEQIENFLEGLYESGALAGRHPAQAYSVRVSPGSKDGELSIRIAFSPERPSEFQIFDIVHNGEGSELRLVPPVEAAQLAG